MTQKIEWVDAHHHLWDLNAVHYPWLAAKGEPRFFGQPDPIRKNYLVEDFCSDHQQQIVQSVHIQVGAQNSLAETQLIQQLSHATKGTRFHFPNAAVVAVNMQQPTIEETLSPHLSYKLVKGVRDIIGKSPEENKYLPEFQPERWLTHWRYLADQSLSFDLQLTSEQYQIVFNTLAQVPELKIAICHFASLWDQSEAGFNHWEKSKRIFASLPNCYMKLSGFSMFKHSFEPNTFVKYAHAAIEIFGPERCMFGSNFPVDKLYVSYADLFIQWQKVISHYTKDEANHLAANTAKTFYKL